VVVEETAGGIALSFGRRQAGARMTAARVEEAIQRRFGRHDAVAVEHRDVRVGRGRYVDFLVPGLLGLFLLTSGLYGIGYTTVQHRQSGILRRLRATPLGRWTYAFAQIAARLSIETVQMAFILTVAALTFGFRPVRPGLDTIAATGALLLVGAFAFIGLGLLVGARARTVETANGFASAINVPMMLLGGVFFPIDDVPPALAPVVRALPLTYLCDGLRKAMIEGVGTSGVLLEIGVLAAWGLATMAGAVRLFKWE
jgi:ABC transporter DrrB family efflux protein